MRAHLYRPITDTLGNVRLGAVVRVLEPGTDTLIAETIYSAETGLGTLPNPLITNGVIDLYLAEPRRVRLGVKVGTEPERFAEAVDVLAPVTTDHDHDGEYAAPGHTHGDLAPSGHTHGTLASLEHTHNDVAPHVHEDNGGTASTTAFTPAGSLSATNVQAALEELDTATQPDGFTPIFFSDEGVIETHTGVLRAYNDSGRTLQILAVRATLGTAGTSVTEIDVNKNGATLFTTQSARPSLASGEVTEVTLPAVTTWENGTYLTCDVDTAGTGAQNLLVQVTVR